MGPVETAEWSRERRLRRRPVLLAMGAVELDGARKAFLQVDFGLPLEHSSQLAVVDVDGTDVDELALGRKRLQSEAARPRNLDEQLGHLAQADRFDRADVED